MTTETAAPSKTRRCKICGFEGPTVSPGIWKSSKGKYHMIPRCQDHDACRLRALAL